MSTKLEKPMVHGTCYTFSIYLCRSAAYSSPSKEDPSKKVPFTNPVVLNIWGGNRYNEERQLLGTTVPVKNIEWNKYDFLFEPKHDFNLLILEAMYGPGTNPYNGNVLVDHASDIVPADCKN